MAFVGVARAVWLFARDTVNHDVFHMVRVKNNIGERISGLKYRIATKPVKIEEEDVPEPYIDWLGQSDQSVDDIFRFKSVGRPRDERERASLWLKEILGKGPLPSLEVRAQGEVAGIAYRTLERVKDEPESGVEVFRHGGSWYWKLTDCLDAPDIIPRIS